MNKINVTDFQAILAAATAIGITAKGDAILERSDLS